MDKIIELRNLTFSYRKIKPKGFKDFNMQILEGEIITLIGTPASGKTTLLKLLQNHIPNNAVYYKGMNAKECNVEELKNNIAVIFDSPIVESSIEKEIKRYVRGLRISEKVIIERFAALDKTFGITKIIDKAPKELSKEDEYLVKILRYLMIKPRFIAIDMILSNLSNNHIKKFFDYIKKNKITLLNVTNDLNLSLYGDKIYVLDDFTLILEGATLSVLKTDTLLKRLGFRLPLAVDLSIELMHYEVIKKIYTEKEKLVNTLWKQ